MPALRSTAAAAGWRPAVEMVDHLLAAGFLAFASSWRIAAMVAAEGSLRLLFFCRRLVLVV